jgi:hypothetical protein
MCFEKIGPYEFNRRDFVATSLAISFLVGARRTRIMMALFVVGGLIATVGGIVSGEWGLAGGGTGALLTVFVIGPALRSRKSSKNTYLSYEEGGLVGENNNVKTLYKWSTIRSHRKIGSRLFVPVSDSTALLIADRFTDPNNMKRLILTLDAHRS